MIKLPDNLIEYLELFFSDLTIKTYQYGKLLNVSLYNVHESKVCESYDIDIVENEVGVTYRKSDGEMDFGGSDIAFATLDEAIAFLTDYRSKI